MRVQPRANPYLGRFLASDLLNRLPAPAAVGPRGRRAMVSVVLAAGVGVTGSTAVASSAAALLVDRSATSGNPAGHAAARSDPASNSATAVQAKTSAAAIRAKTSMAAIEAAIEAQIAAETSLQPPAPVPGYVAAGNAAVGVPGAAPQISLSRVLRRERPKPKPKPKPKPSTVANRPSVTSVVVPSISVERWVDPLPEAKVTSCFGMRWGRLHEGVDLAAPNRTPIRAAGNGVVVAAGPEQGYGNAVLIDHQDGYLTHYAHLSVISVTMGQEVAAGQQIGLEGSTGHATGPHLHFEVHFGFYKNPIEPTAWLRERGIDIAGCEAPARETKAN